MSVRDGLIAKLHPERDPLLGWMAVPPEPIQGWNSDHCWLRETITELKPAVVVEIGAWKGASVATMATQMAQNGHDGAVIAIDTWLGSWEHWADPDLRPELHTLYSRFIMNIVDLKLTDYVVPLRLDSLNAARLFRHLNIRPDLIHLDAGHDYTSVSGDLAAWWPLLQPGGTFLADDYYLDGAWPEVKQAIDDFLPRNGCLTWQALDG